VVDVAQDTAAVLDDLGADSFVTAGWSGGGPHALACAAALPGRCLAAASIAGVAPYPAADQAVLTGEYADHIAACLRAALSSGIAGWRDDDLAFVTDWGFSLDPAVNGEPPLRAAIWQGDQDRMVPFAHGQWLAAAIPGARVHLMPGDGHLSMTVSAFDRILDDLLDLAGLSRRP
jgi:pimeloyl-ACP methyl ester carboxylesterase